MKCTNCTYENEDGAQICTKCGELLILPSSTTIIEGEEDEESEPKFGTVRLGSKLVLDVLDGKLHFEFDREDLHEIIIGRRDPDTGIIPSVDLTEENAVKLGVSRNHAVIVRRDGAVHIADNNSANGTFLNGQRLVADRLRVLRDGDDVRVGKIVLRVTFA